ncbi:DNA transposition protein [Leeia sp. TBRC 13508]|uniref:DNA transposition protein n=1 Tax=Leeia speluncae TaxID=2884804 RepID=A0ABS8D2B5_9NEIS|nr:Mor transcription activator family protein [Leeia speluncae]MCB6182334.1 DNA transposition protein [Leeia speluncae]
MNQRVNIADLASVAHVLPENAQLLVRLIGVQKTLLLVERYGGQTFPISKNKTFAGNIRYQAIAEEVGILAADILTKHFGGEALYIPNCKDAIRETRNRMIRTEFDKHSNEIGVNATVANLATSFGLSDRMIWRILKEVDKVSVNAQQISLF